MAGTDWKWMDPRGGSLISEHKAFLRWGRKAPGYPAIHSFVTPEIESNGVQPYCIFVMGLPVKRLPQQNKVHFTMCTTVYTLGKNSCSYLLLNCLKSLKQIETRQHTIWRLSSIIKSASAGRQNTLTFNIQAVQTNINMFWFSSVAFQVHLSCFKDLIYLRI